VRQLYQGTAKAGNKTEIILNENRIVRSYRSVTCLTPTNELRATAVAIITPFWLCDALTRLPSMTNWQIKDIKPKAWAKSQKNLTQKAP
jgi:hypothetical protein